MKKQRHPLSSIRSRISAEILPNPRRFPAENRLRTYLGTSIPLLLLSSFVCISLAIPEARAQTNTTDIQQKIDQRNQDIQNLVKEIQGYQNQINTLNSQASSLSGTIKSLDLTQKKLAADIRLTQDKIAAKDIEISQLSGEISNKENTIADDQHLIAHAFVTMDQQGNQSLVELLLGSRSISEGWNSMNQLVVLQKTVSDRITELNRTKAGLETNKHSSEEARADLVTLNKQLNDQRSVVISTTAEKNTLLKSTKQSEAQYQQLLAQKQALKDAFEQEILNYESQLKLNVDTSKIPHTGSGVLSWPLDNIQVTQYFGNTAFATANPQIYNGKGHTGVDFRASIGTPVKAALAGIISGVGNTDIVPTCYSYGRWIMVKHPNGLSTLYAHLSLPSVAIGETVTTGQIIGYSGNTGYTTGPHLHFGVYATQGLEIRSFDSSKNCRGVLIPTAPFSAYLNPLSYL